MIFFWKILFYSLVSVLAQLKAKGLTMKAFRKNYPPSRPGYDFMDTLPYFSDNLQMFFVRAVGEQVEMTCRVYRLGNKAVSWIRQRDLSILTVGMYRYTNDARFQSMHSDGSNDWILRITNVKINDSGTYQCQVSTEPKISCPFRLKVTVNRAIIKGSSEMYIKNGNVINLTCTYSDRPVHPAKVRWLYNGLPFGRTLKKKYAMNGSEDFSRLVVYNATQEASGNYTCAPENGKAITVGVHVVNDDAPEAMQQNCGWNCSRSSDVFMLMLSGILFLSVEAHVPFPVNLQWTK